MDSFSSFFDSQPGSRSWSYDSLKNLRQISPSVQNHLKRVTSFFLEQTAGSWLETLVIRLTEIHSVFTVLIVVVDSIASQFCFDRCDCTSYEVLGFLISSCWFLWRKIREIELVCPLILALILSLLLRFACNGQDRLSHFLWSLFSLWLYWYALRSVLTDWGCYASCGICRFISLCVVLSLRLRLELTSTCSGT